MEGYSCIVLYTTLYPCLFRLSIAQLVDCAEFIIHDGIVVLNFDFDAIAIKKHVLGKTYLEKR